MNRSKPPISIEACFCLFVCMTLAPGAWSAEPTLVVIGDRNQEMQSRKMVQAVHSLVKELGVHTSLRWLSKMPADERDQTHLANRVLEEEEAVVLVVWCDFQFETRLFLFERTAQGGHLTVRHITYSTGRIDKFDTIALIVRSHVELLVLGEKLLSQKKPLSFGVSAGYSIRGVSKQGDMLHASLLGLELAGLSRWVLIANYRFRSETKVVRTPVVFRLHGHDLILGGAYQWPTGNLFFGGQASLALSWLPWEIELQAPYAPQNKRQTDVAISAEISLRAGWKMQPWMHLVLTPGICLMLHQVKYDYVQDGKSLLLYSPMQVQWQVSVALTFILGG